MPPTSRPSVPTAEPAPLPAPPAPAEADLAARPVIPLRHPLRWVATAVVLVVLAQVVHGLVTNPFYQWDRFAYWFLRPVVLDGLVITLYVTAACAVLALLVGVVLALARLSRSPVLQAVSWAYVWLFRSVPLIVVLLFLYNFSALYESVGLGVPFGPVFVSFGVTAVATETVIAIVGLTLVEAAYAAEIVRAGILSVDQGQHEAAAALGIPRAHQFRRIVLPQALRPIVPNYVNLLIGLVKSTSLVFYVSLLDLFGTVQSMGATYPGDIVPLLLVATVWYVLLTSVISVVQYHVERRFARGAVRTLPPTPWQRLRAGLGALRARAGAR